MLVAGGPDFFRDGDEDEEGGGSDDGSDAQSLNIEMPLDPGAGGAETKFQRVELPDVANGDQQALYVAVGQHHNVALHTATQDMRIGSGRQENLVTAVFPYVWGTANDSGQMGLEDADAEVIEEYLEAGEDDTAARRFLNEKRRRKPPNLAEPQSMPVVNRQIRKTFKMFQAFAPKEESEEEEEEVVEEFDAAGAVADLELRAFRYRLQYDIH